MNPALTIGLAQVNPIVGDALGNRDRLRAIRQENLGVDLIVCGELTLSGYPPEDLVLKSQFQETVEDAARSLAAETVDGGPALLIGAPWRADGRLGNAVLLLDRGRIADVRFKFDLPNYGVFDEKRVFAAGHLPEPIPFRGVRLGVMICEDMWTPTVATHLKGRGADILVVPNGSPFEIDKPGLRLQLAEQRSGETGLPLIYVNLVGGQDELVFDGASFVVDARGRLTLRAPAWRPGITVSRWARDESGAWHPVDGTIEPEPAGLDAIYQAMVLGLRDYVGKNRFPGVVIGLSGGIDSALTTAIAVDALGAEQVRCVMMPSPFTSPDSLEDADDTAALLGVRLDTISIEPAMAAFKGMLEGVFDGQPADTTEENVQARCRGLVLMALSNKFGHMLLTTGNKSEMSVGYATLYGDMCGGFSVIKDIYKTTVFALAGWRNQVRPDGCLGPGGRVIPERILIKPPTAELKPNQTDQDTLPPYDLLDRILEALIEGDASIDELVGQGFDRAMVRRVWHMIDRAEYKRRQAPPGVKITRRAFGRDRRYPITNGFTRWV
jgi:NAD+ synthase